MNILSLHCSAFWFILPLAVIDTVAIKIGGTDDLFADQTGLIKPVRLSSINYNLFIGIWLIFLTIALVTFYFKKNKRDKTLILDSNSQAHIKPKDTSNSSTHININLSYPSIRQWREVNDQVEQSQLPNSLKERYLEALKEFNGEKMEEVRTMSHKALTPSDIRYMICFSVGMNASDIASIYNVEPSSIYTMRYRLRKKFPREVLQHISFL